MEDDDLDNPFPEPVEIEITDIFDLHTIPPRDVKAVVEEYLRLAHEKGFRSVRIFTAKASACNARWCVPYSRAHLLFQTGLMRHLRRVGSVQPL